MLASPAMTLARLLGLATCALALAASPARAAPPDEEAPALDDDFGPLVEIERIVVKGNSRTAERLVLRALLVHEGDRLRTGDPRLMATRFRVLGLGYFRDVRLRLDKGSRRGAIILTIEVVERGTATLNRVFLGNSEITPVWLGLDVGDANLLGTGVAVGLAFVWASEQELPRGNEQLGFRLRVADPSLLGLPLGARAGFLHADASEPVAGEARGYRRTGGTAGLTFELSPVTVVSLDGRVEDVRADDLPPPALLAGGSLVTTVAAGFELDTRRDPILPDRGDRLALAVETGFGDYPHVRLLARWQHFRKLGGRHVGSLQLAGGVIAGDAPLFDRFHVGDLNPFLPPRALDLVVSDRPSPDLLGSGMDEVSYGRLYGGVTLEYAYQLFRSGRAVYGGDLFAAVGVFALGETDDARADLTFNAGLRLDTLIGIFELSLGNALGRIPF
jgi:outer membrane protein insertion porin family